MSSIKHGVEVYVKHGRSKWKKVPFEAFQFPGGELQLRNFDTINTYEDHRFTVYVRGADPVTMVVVQLVHDYLLVNHSYTIPVIVAPYLPAARSDRGKYATISPYEKMIKPKSSHLCALDIHNPKADRLSHQVCNVTAISAIRETDAIPTDKYAGVIAPDEGAMDRAWSVAKYLGVPTFYAKKERDFETGKITGLTPPVGLDPEKYYLVVDDIFDGGRTFRVLAEALNLPKLDLWVTHGIFSGNYWENLLGFYTNVYTTNSHPGVDHLSGLIKYEDKFTSIRVVDIKEVMIGEIE